MGTPSNIYSNAISYNCAKFGAFVNSVTILMLRDLTIMAAQKVLCFDHVTNWSGGGERAGPGEAKWRIECALAVVDCTLRFRLKISF